MKTLLSAALVLGTLGAPMVTFAGDAPAKADTTKKTDKTDAKSDAKAGDKKTDAKTDAKAGDKKTDAKTDAKTKDAPKK